MQSGSIEGRVKLSGPGESAVLESSGAKPVVVVAKTGQVEVDSATDSESEGSRSGRKFDMMAGLVNRDKTHEHVIPSRHKLVPMRPARVMNRAYEDDEGSSVSGSDSYDSSRSGSSRSRDRRLDSMAAMAKDPVLMQMKQENEQMKAQLSMASSLQEKGRMIQKLRELDAQGYKGTKPINTAMSQQELATELAVAEAAKQRVETGDNMRQLLIMGVGAVEYANRRYLKSKLLNLDGWTAQVSSSITSFDRPLNRLAEKYGRVGSHIEPEWELLLMLSGSAIMFHVTKQFAQQHMPSMLDVANSNPELADAIARIMAERMAAEAEESGVRETERVPTDDEVESILAQEGLASRQQDDMPSDMPPLARAAPSPLASASEAASERPQPPVVLVEANSFNGLASGGETGNVPKSDSRNFMLPVPDYMRRPAASTGPLRLQAQEDDAASTTSGGRKARKGVSLADL